MERLAHISEDGTRFQTIRDHLENTAKIAGEFAASFGADSNAILAGQLHDIGKYSDAFQKRLHGGPRTDHSTAGAQEACNRKNLPVAFAVAGHHGGIPDGGNPHDTKDDSTLCGRMKRKTEECSEWKSEINPEKNVTLPKWFIESKDNNKYNNFSQAFFTRMLYSCLVDADFLDTETFMDGKEAPRGMGEKIPVLMDKVMAQANQYLENTNPSDVIRVRNQVLKDCLDSGKKAQGLYTLTVPTGGGKTFASLAFALKHAAAHGMDRVIYVIPYTSIIDQTAQIFTKLLGEENVLAHFSTSDYKMADEENMTALQYRQLLSSENWDAPVIITTAVQFFESLYSNRSSRCRKLHNIANSTIIFDEAQTLPNDTLKPCVAAIAELVQHYHTTAVLCTATQPVLNKLFEEFAPDIQMTEISSEPESLYKALGRNTIQNAEKVSTKEILCEELSMQAQVLCVVNRRKTAQDLYEKLPEDGRYCLTTLLCAADRKRLMNEIRERLKNGEVCRVVSTSLIEAGVDVDFPTAYRETAGLDSILQTAGRCNREGKRLAKESFVFYFELDGQNPPSLISQNISAFQQAARKNSVLNGQPAIHDYFESLYRSKATLDKKGILDAFENGIDGCCFPFAQVSALFQMIESQTKTVYIPIEEGAELCEKLKSGIIQRSIYRKLGAYSVECYKDQYEALDRAGALEITQSGAVILNDITKYSRNTGLSMNIETGQGIFF